jgi:hypothetical protein
LRYPPSRAAGCRALPRERFSPVALQRPQEISALPPLLGVERTSGGQPLNGDTATAKAGASNRDLLARPSSSAEVVRLFFSWFEPPIDHRYAVNERRSSLVNATKNANVLRDSRASRPAHNGLVAGSSPAGPTSPRKIKALAPGCLLVGHSGEAFRHVRSIVSDRLSSRHLLFPVAIAPHGFRGTQIAERESLPHRREQLADGVERVLLI